MQQPQGCKQHKLCQAKQRHHWHRGCCMQAWLFCTSCCGGLPERRTVCPLILQHTFPNPFTGTFHRQKNMDYCTFNALAYNTKDEKSGDTIQSALIAYDVACQYSVGFKKRWNDSLILQSIFGWFIASIIWAIGKFHLGAHKEACYPEYSLNHIEGAADEDGEGMERAWSNIIAILMASRTSTKGRRVESGNNVMQGNNYKTTIKMGQSSPPSLPSTTS